MKADIKELERISVPSENIHTIKVDYGKLEIFQIPEREPKSIKVTEELMRQLEGIDVPEQSGIKVNYRALGLPDRRVNVPVKWMAVAACFLLVVSGFLFHPWQTKQALETASANGVAVTRMADSGAETTQTEMKVVITETPDVTETPVPTDTPEPTNTPEVTPEPTNTPEVTKTPKPTPEVTKKPATTQKSKATKKPKPAPKPTPAPKKKIVKKAKASKDGYISLGSGWTITHYCPGSCCNGGYAGRTSTGAKPKPYHTIAVDPSVIPYGTHVRIEGYDYDFVAEDCGGKIKGKHIDVLVGSHSTANQMGKRTNVKVSVKRK